VEVRSHQNGVSVRQMPMVSELTYPVPGSVMVLGRVMVRVLIITLFLTLRIVSCSFAGAGEVASRETPPGEAPPRTGALNKDKVAGYVLFGSVLVLGTIAAFCEVESDREYSRYLETAHPTRMRSHYDRAERYRDLSNAALIGAEACAVGLVAYLLQGKQVKEPQPEGVRISLELCPPRAEFSFRW